MRVLFVRKKLWGYYPLANEMNAGGHLCMYWYYSKGTMDPST